MQVRANCDEKFFIRFLIIGIVCLAYSLWCLYDGLIAYPEELVRSEIYHNDFAGGGEEAQAAWLQRTEQEGWSALIPRDPEKIRNGIVLQYIQIAVCLVVGIPMILKYLMARGSFIEANQDEIRPSWTKPVPFTTIAKIDKTRWEKKGIAKLHYQSDGATKVFVMDDFKFSRPEMAAIMAFAEKDLDDSAIIGGKRETLLWSKDETGQWICEQPEHDDNPTT